MIVSVDELASEPYASVLCFPKVSKNELEYRIRELRSCGVKALEFSGKASIFGVPVPVLGKGFVGVVVVAHLLNGERVAAKIRRVDANRVDLFHEAKMLSKANLVSFTPKLIAVTKNLLLMQLIEGDALPSWITEQKDADLVRRVLRNILESCFCLDNIGLDHGELSNASKHILLDSENEPWIVDFETASDRRNSSNLSSICSYLFTNDGEMTRTVNIILGDRDRTEIVNSLRQYKKLGTEESFAKVLQVCLH